MIKQLQWVDPGGWIRLFIFPIVSLITSKKTVTGRDQAGLVYLHLFGFGMIECL